MQKSSKPALLLGIDIGGTTISAFLCTQNNDEVARHEWPTGEHTDPKWVANRVASTINYITSKANIRDNSIRHCGIGMPGIVDFEKQQFVASPIFPSWKNVEFASLLRVHIDIPITLDNDANCALEGALVEFSVKPNDPVLLVTVGTGIGGALWINGRIVRGAGNTAGEIGHISVDSKMEICWCGNHGCLGLLASTTRLLANYAATSHTAETNLSGLQLTQRYFEDDPIAKSVVSNMSMYLARGIETAASLVAPKTVFLCGGIMNELGDTITAQIKRQLSTRRYPGTISTLEIRIPRETSFIGAIGASQLWQYSNELETKLS